MIQIWERGYTMDEFIQKEFVEKLVKIEENGPTAQTDPYIKLNYQRSKRSAKQFTLNETDKQLLETYPRKEYWLVLTEAWCGDSAQSLPIIASIAAASPNLSLKIILRDENQTVMDNFLTNGARAIPKLIALDKDGQVLYTWGPRPKEAVRLFTGLKNEGMDKSEIYVHLHKWYAQDKGIHIKNELLQLLRESI